LQDGAEIIEEQAGASFLDFVLGGNFRTMNARVGVALDIADLKNFATGHKRNGATTASRTTGPSDPVDVIFHIVGKIVVEDDLDIIDIDAAGGDVGGHEEFEAGFAEAVHHAIAQGLAHVAVQTVRGIALGVQMFDKVVDHSFGVAEDDAELEVMDVDQAREEFDLKTPVHFVVSLLDRRDGQCFLLDADILRITRMLFNQLLNDA